MAVTLTLTINGAAHQVSVPDAGMPLLWVIRDIIGLTGTKYGCGRELCGACAVLVNGQKELSCDMDVSSAVGRDIWTIEGLAAKPDPIYQKVQQAWVKNQVPQCGYCQSGMIVAAVGALKGGHSGADAVNEIDHLCVCGTYPRIKQALQSI